MAQIIRIYQHGDPSVLQLEEAEVGNPDAGEVRIKQDAIGVNFVDTMVRDGRYPVALPTVPGFEGAGVITAVGSGVKNFAVGDRVGYFFSAGAYASDRIIEATALVQLPDDLSTVNAATYMAKGLTAWMALRALHQLRKDEVVLVQGASGSVGSMISRWARALGATVIGVAGTPEKLAKVRAGAQHALYAHDDAFPDKIRAIASGGVDVVFDLVGQASSSLSVGAVRNGGEIITIGAASGQPNMDRVILEKRSISVKGGGTPQFVNEHTIQEASAELFEAIRSGIFSDLNVVHYHLQYASAAHRAIEKRDLQGLPVLLPSASGR